MHNSQKFITFLIVIKIYCDLSYLYHIMTCKHTGDGSFLEKITFGINNLLQPVFEGTFIFLLLSLALVIGV